MTCTATATEIPAAHLATVSRNRYRGIDTRPATGWNLYLGGELLIMGIPMAWANKAARLVNECPTLPTQAAEVRRIRAAIEAATA